MADASTRLTTALAERYGIERELGRGGMATVYLAHDRKHDREVALKVLKPELAAILGRERFLNEIRLTARLDHPRILTLIDSGETDGFFWYVTPYVRGESLRALLIREKQLGLDESLAITRQIATALGYAHEKGVIHRDIKPENILLHEGEAVLTDFGIALAVKEASGNRLTEAGLSLGTPEYMSPEQATGVRELDARSDIYSLGAVLYEMLTGEPPFSGATAHAVIAKLMTERPTRIRTVRDTVPEGVDAAVARALAKVPADRYPSAAAFITALEEASRPAAGRKRSPLLVAAGLVSVVIIGLVGVMLARRPHFPVMYRPLQLTSTGTASGPVLSPDGSQVAYAESRCDERQQCRVDLVIQETATGDERVVMSNLDVGAFWRWSPNGLWLLGYIGEAGQPARGVVLSRLGERIRDLGSYYQADFVAADTIAAIQSPSIKAGIVPVQLMSATSTLQYGTLSLRAPEVKGYPIPVNLLMSPDARWMVLVWITRQGEELTLYDRSGRLLDSASVARWSQHIRWDPASRALFGSLPQSGAITGTVFGRLMVDARRRRFGRSDTLFVTPAVNAQSGFDLAADGRSLVVASGQRDSYEVWGAERRDTVFQPVHRLLHTTERSGAWITRDGRTIVYSQPRGGDPTAPAWWAVPFDSGPPRLVGTSPGSGHGFALSLDDRLLYNQQITNGTSQVVAYNIRGGPATTILESPDTGISLIEAEGGGVGVLNSATDTLAIYSSSGRRLRDVVFPAGDGFLWLLASPDGSAYALAGNDIQRDADGNWVFTYKEIDARTGVIRPLATIALNWIGWQMWGSHGLLVEMKRSRDWRRGLYRDPLDGSPPVLLGMLPFGDRANCTMDSEGDRVACMVSNPVTDLYIIRDFHSAP